jgi:hypothetical protein
MEHIIEESLKYLLELEKDVHKGMTSINETHKKILKLFQKLRKLDVHNLPSYEIKSIKILFKKNFSKTNISDIFFMTDRYSIARSEVLDILFYQYGIHFQLENMLKYATHKRKFEKTKANVTRFSPVITTQFVNVFPNTS